MGAIKQFCLNAYYDWKDGLSIEDISKKYNVDVETVKLVVELTNKDFEEMEKTEKS